MRDDASRGQLITTGAISVAVLFVSVALLVNATLFVEHESQASDSPTHDQAMLDGSLEQAVSGGLLRVNDRNNHSYATLTENVSSVVDIWEGQVNRDRVPSGAAVDAEVRSVDRGARLVADQDGRQLTSAGGSGDWTLVTDVTAARESQLELAGTDLVTRGDPGVFRLVVDDGSATWELTVANASDGTLPEVGSTDDVVVNVTTAAGTTTCVASTRPVSIDLTGGELNGADCPDLDFRGAVDTPYEIRIENGTSAAGTYRLTVRNETALPANYADGGVPRADPQLYTVTTDLRYVDDTLEYRRTQETAPDETA